MIRNQIHLFLLEIYYLNNYTGNNINLNVFSDKQILELDIHEVKCIDNDSQIMLLYTNNTGSKIYWDNNILKIPNDPNFNLELKTPCKLTLELNNDIFLYIDGILKTSGKSYTSIWFKYTGIQFIYSNRDLIVTGFRYKNFNRGE